MDDFDFLGSRVPRTALDDAADRMGEVSQTAWEIRDEISGWSAVAGERHAEIISHINWTIDGKLGSIVQLLDTLKWLLWGVIGLLAFIAFHLK